MARALLNEEEYFQFNDLQSLDSQLHRSLQQLKSFIHTNQTDSVEGIMFSLFPSNKILKMHFCITLVIHLKDQFKNIWKNYIWISIFLDIKILNYWKMERTNQLTEIISDNISILLLIGLWSRGHVVNLKPFDAVSMSFSIYQNFNVSCHGNCRDYSVDQNVSDGRWDYYMFDI